MVTVGRKKKGIKDGSDFQTNNAVDINLIEVTNNLYFAKYTFLFSIILLALPASFYHSLLPETFSSLGFENIALLFFPPIITLLSWVFLFY